MAAAGSRLRWRTGTRKTVSHASAADRLIVALDAPDYDRAAALVDQLSPHVGWFKVGSVLFTREGPRVCRLVKEAGTKLFLDLKYHDIPNTVRGAVASALDMDADMLTVHASGGESMLRAAVEARDASRRSDALIVAVTVLTSFSADAYRSLFDTGRTLSEAVVALAGTAREAGVDGIVASAHELPAIRRHLGDELKVVTPGIRLPGSKGDDQTRIVTPKAAVERGADYLVVGRPIIAAPDPIVASRQILQDMIS